MNKFKAFTMIELLVAMTINSIVIGLILTIYLNINEYYTNFKNTGEKDYKLLMIVSQLRADIDKSSEIRGNSSQISLFSEADHIINYSFNSNNIIRFTNETTDTFYNPQEDVEVKYLENNNDLINEITLTLIHEKQKYSLHLTKEYSRDIMFNTDILNHEH